MLACASIMGACTDDASGDSTGQDTTLTAAVITTGSRGSADASATNPGTTSGTQSSASVDTSSEADLDEGANDGSDDQTWSDDFGEPGGGLCPPPTTRAWGARRGDECIEVGGGEAFDEVDPQSLGERCPVDGTLACGGNDNKFSLLCLEGRWQLNEHCDEAHNCDTVWGVCTPIVAPCRTRAPGELFCKDEDTLAQCGPDRVTLQTNQCCGVCATNQHVASCQPKTCGDGKLHPGELCDDGNDVIADGCEPDCQPSEIVQLSAGLTHTCALLRGGYVRCWGGNDFGQLGQGHRRDLRGKLPFEIPPIRLCEPAVRVEAGAFHSCALMASGAVQCWGYNRNGQLGLGHTRNIGDNELPGAPVSTVPLGRPATHIAAGGSTSCAVLDDATLRCWGSNRYGGLGLGHTDTIGDDELPTAALAQVRFETGTRVVDADHSGDHGCAVLDPPEFRCWGANRKAQLGVGVPAWGAHIGDDELPTRALTQVKFRAPENLRSPVRVQVGLQHSALMSYSPDLTVAYGTRTVGYNVDGSLGLGRLTDETREIVPEYTAIGWHDPPIETGVGLGRGHICKYTRKYRITCRGHNQKAQLGNDTTQDAWVSPNTPDDFDPVDFGLDEFGQTPRAHQVIAGELHTCAFLEPRRLKCWGYNADGQLGLGYASEGEVDFVGGRPDLLPGDLPDIQVFPPSEDDR